jgi:outer membrane biosynthesis protein TonB
MDSEIVALVKSPAKSSNYLLRKGNGFSLKEIKEAGLSIQILKDMNIKIDYYRRSANQMNIETLKTLEVPKKKGKKRKPFVKKEKKRTPFKPKEGKKKKKPTKVKEKAPEKPAAKKPKAKERAPTKKKPEKEKAPAAKINEIEKALEKSKATAEKEGTPLIKLSGLGITTAKKFEGLGVTSIEGLINEDPVELAKLIKGCSEVKISTWIKEGEKILKESE